MDKKDHEKIDPFTLEKEGCLFHIKFFIIGFICFWLFKQAIKALCYLTSPAICFFIVLVFLSILFIWAYNKKDL